MNNDRFAGICKQLKGELKGRWGRWASRPLVVAAGARDKFAGRVQERYGVSKERLARRLRDFLDRNHGNR